MMHDWEEDKMCSLPSEDDRMLIKTTAERKKTIDLVILKTGYAIKTLAKFFFPICVLQTSVLSFQIQLN